MLNGLAVSNKRLVMTSEHTESIPFDVFVQDPRGELYHASLKLTMTSYNSANSQDCIAAGTCKPLGGYSVWSAVPPLPADPRTDRRPIILVVAQIDGIDMFHDKVQVSHSGDTV